MDAMVPASSAHESVSQTSARSAAGASTESTPTTAALRVMNG